MEGGGGVSSRIGGLRTSIVHQGSILHSVLFNIFIYYLNDGVVCSLSKFADGTKLERAPDTPEDDAAVQSDLDRLEKWAGRNLMQFRERKCEVLHLGRNNSMHLYVLGSTQLESSSVKKDLVVLVDTTLNASSVPLQQKGKQYLGLH